MTAPVPEVYEDIDMTFPSYWCPINNLLISYADEEHGHVWVEVHERKRVTMRVADGPGPG